MTREESAAAELEQASERWLAWLTAETTGRQPPSGPPATTGQQDLPASAPSATGPSDPPGSALDATGGPGPSGPVRSASGGPEPSGSDLDAAGRPGSSGSALSALWDALESWFASDDFADSVLAAAVVAPPDGRGPAAHAVLVRHRQATRRLLEDVARSAGARDPAALAGQLLTLVEGAMAGALVDRHPGVARHARELTRIALTASTRG